MTATRPRRISVIGAGSCDAATAAVAQRLGTLLAVCGFEVVCGGGGGVMEAVCRGAREAGGRTIGILPGNDREAANPHVEVAIATGMGIARNVLVVVNGDAAVAVAGGAGPLAEIGLAPKLGRPVVAFGHYGTLPGVVAAASPEEAAQTVAALLDGS